MITKVFWTLVALDAIAAFVLGKFFAKGTHGLLVVAYMAVVAFIVITTLVFPLLRSQGLRIAAIVVLVFPSAILLFTSVAATVGSIQDKRRFSGSAYFDGSAFELAQAMLRRDTAMVKQLIPAAGDLNQPRGSGMTLWRFGVLQAEETDESIEMLRALIAAGADPKRDTSSDTLTSATTKGPRLTLFLLEAGANPNVLDFEKRPLWWGNIGPGEDDASTELLRLMLDHGADLSLRAPDGRGPVGQALATGYWYDACLLIERGADWKHEQVRGSIPQSLEWEIIRREEYPIPVPELLRKVLADMKGEPMVVPVARPLEAGDIRIPDLLSKVSVDTLDETRAAVSRLSQEPNWVRRLMAFTEDGDTTKRQKVVLMFSLKPEALPEDVQERCWTELREQVAWFDRSAASYPKEPKGWLLKETAAIAIGLASIPGPVRERHRADFTGLRARIEACRKANDPSAPSLPDLKKADWMGGQAN